MKLAGVYAGTDDAVTVNVHLKSDPSVYSFGGPEADSAMLYVTPEEFAALKACQIPTPPGEEHELEFDEDNGRGNGYPVVAYKPGGSAIPLPGHAAKSC
jgi:hypothetical protein